MVVFVLLLLLLLLCSQIVVVVGDNLFGMCVVVVVVILFNICNKSNKGCMIQFNIQVTMRTRMRMKVNKYIRIRKANKKN